MDAANETTRPCWCGDVHGLLSAMLPYAIRSFNESLDDARKLFADRFIADVGYALQPFHAGETVADSEREAARRLVTGVTAMDADKLIVELGAIAVTRALLMLRTLIQRLTRAQRIKSAHRGLGLGRGAVVLIARTNSEAREGGHRGGT